MSNFTQENVCGLERAGTGVEIVETIYLQLDRLEEKIIADMLCPNQKVSLGLMVLVAVLLVMVLVRHNPSRMFLLVV